MPDKEKVIKAIENCIGQPKCKDCPWEDCCEVEHEVVNSVPYGLMRDVIALLKEQEAVEPKQVDLYGNDEWWGLVCICPDCKAEWMSDKADTHFCTNCGKPVKWE